MKSQSCQLFLQSESNLFVSSLNKNNRMKKIALSLLVVAGVLSSCSSDDDGKSAAQIQTPASYSFERDGESTVSFEGQSTRIFMAEALLAALSDNTKTEAELEAMFAHVEGANDFSDASLNASSKSIRSKVAASADYFSANTTLAASIKADFDTWISNQANVVFPSWYTIATPGNAGQLQQAGGGSIRYINAKGFEYTQLLAKGLLGGLMTDQILNNYLSPAVLDEASNRENNLNTVLEEGENYTTMEHKWDEAYGYIYGAEADPSLPVLDADKFLSEYVDRVEADADFAGIAQTIFDAFKLGRAAIIANDYDLRDVQANSIREQISKIIAIRAVYYLQGGKDTLATGDYASAFHALSESYGFIYSLQFTRQLNTNAPYFSHAEVTEFTDQLSQGNGLWEVTPETLDDISETIATRFNFTVEAASN